MYVSVFISLSLSLSLSLCVCVCVCLCMCMCVRLCTFAVCAHLYASVRACVFVRVMVQAYLNGFDEQTVQGFCGGE